MSDQQTIDFQAIFESSPLACLVLSHRLTVLAVSDCYLAAIKATRKDIVGRDVFDVVRGRVDGGDASLRASLDRVRLHRVPDSMAVQPYPHPEGEGVVATERYQRPVNVPVFSPDGQMRYIVHRIDDVTEQVRLERDASAKNAELEQFAYAASHDLQEPLRMVSSYVQLLARRYQGRLGQDADEFIGFAVDGARRMQALIADLLRFSRIDTQAKPFAPAPLDAVVDRVLARMQNDILATNAHITRASLPVVMADASQMEQVFQNLIGNALKFHGDAPPRIHIGYERRESEHLLFVRDNGIGIDPQHNERVFVIFQRLHGRDAYPGTGVGLALCKRVVERHRGRIWAESAPGKGATFYFTIPDLERR